VHAGISSAAELYQQIQDCGFFPDLVVDCISQALGDEEPAQHLVHHEATFDGEEINRHLTALVLTPTRLLVSHTDEDVTDSESPEAVTSLESIPLRLLGASTLTQVIAHPASYQQGASQNVETWLALSWGTVRHAQIEPAHCADPNCTAEHGYDAESVAEDLVVRMSRAADGPDAVAQLVSFATALQQVTARFHR
jgi:hypothetical protein